MRKLICQGTGLVALLVVGLAGAVAPARAQDDADKPLAPECAGAATERLAPEPPSIEFDDWFDTTNPLLGFAAVADPISDEKAAGESCNTPDAVVVEEAPYEKTDDAERLLAQCASPSTITLEAGLRDLYAPPQDPVFWTPQLMAAVGLPFPSRWTAFDQPGADIYFGHQFRPVFTNYFGYRYGILTIRLKPFSGQPENDTLSLFARDESAPAGAPQPPGWGVSLSGITPIRPGREVTLRLDLRTLSTGSSNILADISRFHNLNIVEQDDHAFDHMELTLSCQDPASTGLVGVIPGPSGCGKWPIYEVFLDNEDSRNANNRGGWIGATVSNKNTLIKICAVDGYLFAPAAEAGANFGLLALSGACPAGFTRFDRFHDNEDNRPASYDTLPGGSPTTTVQPQQNTNMAFCVATGRSSGVPSSIFPDLGSSYGVFGARSGATWPLERGFLYLDDEDKNNKNEPGTGPSYTTEFVQLGKNTTYFLARVK